MSEKNAETKSPTSREEVDKETKRPRPKPKKKRRTTRPLKSDDDIKATQISKYGDLATAKKKCPHCPEAKPLSEFGIARVRPDGLTTNCKKHKKMKAIVVEKPLVPVGMKKCLDCPEPRPVSEFGVDSDNRLRCVVHTAMRRRVYDEKYMQKQRARTPEEIKSIQIELYGNGANAKKQCHECRKDVLLTDYGEDMINGDGLKFNCQICCKEGHAAWRESNKKRSAEEVIELQLNLYGPESQKVCLQCTKMCDLSEFGIAPDLTDGLKTKCLVCTKENAAKRAAVARPLFDQLKAKPCAECNECFPPAAMDFAHLPGTTKYRTKNGTTMQPGTMGRLHPETDAFKEELRLVRLLCANCHAIETYTTLKHKKPRTPMLQKGYDIVNGIKRDRGYCIDCKRPVIPGFEFMFDFDHRPGVVKINRVANMIKQHVKVIAETAKCDLRCKNCHRIVTQYTRKGKPIPVVSKSFDAESKEDLVEDIHAETIMMEMDDIIEFGASDSDDDEERSSADEESPTKEENETVTEGT